VTDCFVCEGPRDLALDRPGAWLEPRYACPTHARAAALPTGEALVAFLGRRRPAGYPLEGSGLNWVINPAKVEAHGAWLDFHFAWPAVIEEVFPSGSYFDFLAQHRPELVTLLHHLSEEDRLREAVPAATSLLRVLARDPSQAGACSNLSRLWAHQLAVDAALAGRVKPFVETPEEAEAVAHAGFATVEPTLDTLAQKLIQVASTRFAQLR
jgi:hypothetical protein